MSYSFNQWVFHTKFSKQASIATISVNLLEFKFSIISLFKLGGHLQIPICNMNNMNKWNHAHFLYMETASTDEKNSLYHRLGQSSIIVASSTNWSISFTSIMILNNACWKWKSGWLTLEVALNGCYFAHVIRISELLARNLWMVAGNRCNGTSNAPVGGGQKDTLFTGSFQFQASRPPGQTLVTAGWLSSAHLTML